MKGKGLLYALVLIGSLTTCVDPFDIDSVGETDLLVVEGLITDARGESRIMISRSTTIDGNSFQPVTDANVTVRTANGEEIPFTMADTGVYRPMPFFSGRVGETYQLFIDTEPGSSYQSEPVVMRATPPIRQVTAKYERTDNGASQGPGFYFFVDTEDFTNNTRFYRWEWEETFEVNALFESKFVHVGGNNVNDRLNPVDRCWAEDRSNTIIIRSTEGLAADVVDKQFIHHFPPGTDAMYVRYSLLVRQFSLSKTGFEFWEQLRTLNEDQGTLFDAQPGAVDGNIVSTSDPDETVLGYFDAMETKEERAFFGPQQFRESGFAIESSTLICDIDSVTISELDEFYARFELSSNPPLIHDLATPYWLIVPKACADCSDRGTIFEPEFW